MSNETRADAVMVRRVRVLRWLTRLARDATSRAARAQPEHHRYEIAKAETLTQMVDDFARGREG